MPPYYAQKMASENHLPLLVKSSVTDDGGEPCRHLDMTATKDESGSTLVLHIANLSPSTETVRLDIPAPESPDSLSALTLSGDPDDVNTVSEPEKTVPAELDTYILSGKYCLDLPAYSYTVVKVAY